MSAPNPLGVDPFAPVQIRAAIAAASERGIRAVAILEEQSNLAPEQFVRSLGQRFGFQTLSMDALDRLNPAFDILPYAESREHGCILFQDELGNYLLTFADVFSSTLQPWANERLRVPFDWRLAHAGYIDAYLRRHEDGLSAMDDFAPAPSEADATETTEELSLAAIGADDSPVVRFVNSALYDALQLGASDIHLETDAGELVLKYRLDGVLSLGGRRRNAQFAEEVVSRIKVMAELDIAERRIPQDGRFRIRHRGQDIDVRVSIMPSIHGEDAVLRILDKRALAAEMKGLRLDALGFNAAIVTRIRRLSTLPHGMLLVTGPTGSGKTTTLYAAITEINSGRDKIITIEDPVEYQLPGVLQIPVNEKKGLSFARGLRSILRHDPDRIMVGEIRDNETAQIAIQAALTGHLVFTTVHANNVFDVIGRFAHMQVDTHAFVSALNAIVAQRLVRINCPHCTHVSMPSEMLLEESGLTVEDVAGYRFRAGGGCGHCHGTGYRGRRAIAELLLLNDELRGLIGSRHSPAFIREAARRYGLHELRESALELVASGETTLSEINRVTLVA